MTRPVATLVLLTLLVPLAAAAPGTDVENAQPMLPDLRPAAEAIATGTENAADATGDALAALGSGIASLAKATGRAIGAVFSALGSALAAIGGALASLAGAIGSALASFGALLGRMLGSGARYAAAHPKESAIVGGSATGLGLLGYAAKKWWLSLFVPLYSRLAKSEMLDNKVRSSVYEHVKAHPGAHPSGIADTLGLGWGTVVYHLARLEDASLVSVREAHNRKCYFTVGGDLDNAGRTAVAAMSTDKARAIVDVLRAEPNLSQKELAERLGMSQALASWHVKRLVGSGVILTRRVGRSNLLAVAGHVPVLAPAPAQVAPLAA